ncbi:hypothetical protein [Iningainema tapete]|uniref:Uncharacterized protein n=1 Tax=Iningainema tapete BLCC-T55 TaxID=2748662 RepID=A0A8J6XUB8_9CYAN|nr:hypothetical protein [Iningainema tapete]MBD2778639.1 hypothetical protein [Iningainema tapete BLCC-T55]
MIEQLLEAQPTRPEELKDKEIWQPRWNCFCCQDTGKIQPHLVRLVIPTYDYNRDNLPICQNCNKGANWLHLKGNIDTRISLKTCKKLDVISRRDWKRTTKEQFEMARKLVAEVSSVIAQKNNFRNEQLNRIHQEFILWREFNKPEADEDEVKEEEEV